MPYRKSRLILHSIYIAVALAEMGFGPYTETLKIFWRQQWQDWHPMVASSVIQNRTPCLILVLVQARTEHTKDYFIKAGAKWSVTLEAPGSLDYMAQVLTE